MSRTRLKKGDLVEVLRGKDRGRRGKILSQCFEEGRSFVTVEKVAIVKRHQRPTQKLPGGIMEKPAWIDASKVMWVCPKCEKPSRVGRSVADGEKVRRCKKCDGVIA